MFSRYLESALSSLANIGAVFGSPLLAARFIITFIAWRTRLGSISTRLHIKAFSQNGMLNRRHANFARISGAYDHSSSSKAAIFHGWVCAYWWLAARRQSALALSAQPSSSAGEPSVTAVGRLADHLAINAGSPNCPPSTPMPSRSVEPPNRRGRRKDGVAPLCRLRSLTAAQGRNCRT